MEGEYTRAAASARPTAPTVVVVGCASRDLGPDDPRGWRLGGAVTYGALTLARLGLRTAALVGVDPPAHDAWELDLLRRAGVSLELVRLVHGPVFRNVEGPTGRVQTCLEPGQPLDPAALPAAWRAAPGWFFGPITDELPEAWAAVPAAGTTVALGWQGLLRGLRAGGQVRRRDPRPSAIVGRADLVGVSRYDLDGRLGLDALAAGRRAGAAQLVTCSGQGGLIATMDAAAARQWRRYPALPGHAEVDPTGAGDVMLAGLLAARLVCPPERLPVPGADLAVAAAAASLVVERPGLLGVPTLGAVRERLAGRG